MNTKITADLSIKKLDTEKICDAMDEIVRRAIADAEGELLDLVQLASITGDFFARALGYSLREIDQTNSPMMTADELVEQLKTCEGQFLDSIKVGLMAARLDFLAYSIAEGGESR